MADNTYFETYKDRDGLWRWRCVTANGDLIGVATKGYRTKSDCQDVIAAVKAAADAPERELADGQTELLIEDSRQIDLG